MTYAEASVAVGLLVVGFDGPPFVREKAVEEEDSRGASQLVKEGLGPWVLVQPGAKREAGNVLDPLEGRPVGQKVKGIAQQDRLGVGNRLHSRHVADYFGLDEKKTQCF